MSISNRFRDIAKDVNDFWVNLKGCDVNAEQPSRVVKKANKGLQEWVEPVGEIPRIRLESELTPILLKAHDTLDKARLVFEDVEGLDVQTDTTWELPQKIYSLRNDL
mgnify:CR=1 FL=1